jgi:hypothetical protein
VPNVRYKSNIFALKFNRKLLNPASATSRIQLIPSLSMLKINPAVILDAMNQVKLLDNLLLEEESVSHSLEGSIHF